MTATAVQVSQQEGVSEKEWVRLFPKEMTENYTSSVTFMKQLTVVAVSTITYLKNAFPEESYYSETFGGLKLKVLRDRCQDELAQFVSTSLRQAFDAFDKKYVHQLALCFYRGSCAAANLLEYHVFEYAYGPGGASLTLNSKSRDTKKALRCSVEAVRTRTAMLVRSLSLFVWQNCTQELPCHYDVSLRLYYNEDCPAEYQAPGFVPPPEPDHLAAAAGAPLCLGWVETPFHKLIARSFVQDLCDASDVAAPSDNLAEMTQDESEDLGASAPRVRCPCALADAEPALLTCQYCGTQQHAACFGLMGPEPEHCCAACAAGEPARASSCAMLVGLAPRKQECLCLFRRTLVLCAARARVAGAELQARLGLTPASAARMLRLLQSHYVLPNTDEQDLTVPRKINPVRLKLAFKHFFRVEESPDSTDGARPDQLWAEDSRADQVWADESRADPLADVLSPLEQVALHDTSLLGTVVDADNPMPATDADPALQQYKDVLVPEAGAARDELPLSGDHNPVRRVADIGRKLKRRQDADDDGTPSKLPKLRSGTKTKKKL